ncbi:hypothetical protein RHMOL_Rhmol02G0044000 [Rhododendron molle]|uniref:Uncharacterized protein n=1 Tax=Rhododendron molle TaxID=49168 RepID=A0ACC0PMW2_RHOML|nr:hypothetical protein RHMOL_Rhmol02G0044000 [Rhododendron molle]
MCSHLNIGSFTTVEDAVSAYEVVMSWSGWTDLNGFHGLFENENRSKLPLQLPPLTQEFNPIEDLDWCVGTGSERTGERVMADQARLNSECLEKRKAKEKNPPGGEKRKKKTNGVRMAILLVDISQTKGMRLIDAANHLEVY